MLWYFKQAKMGWISWLMFMINPRKKQLSFLAFDNVLSALTYSSWNPLWNWSYCCMISCQTGEHMYWPGVRSCHRGWRTSAKSSCLRGGWWQEIWPWGSFASLLQYADNPSRGEKKEKKSKITGGTQVKHITFVPPLNARSLIVKCQSMNTCEKGHVSANQAVTFLCIFNSLNWYLSWLNKLGGNRNSQAINKLQSLYHISDSDDNDYNRKHKRRSHCIAT